MGGTDVDAPLKLSLERLAQVRRGGAGAEWQQAGRVRLCAAGLGGAERPQAAAA